MKHAYLIPEIKIAVNTSANFPVTAYSEFFMENFPDVQGKNVADFGAGSGILTLFAIYSGASKVLAIDIDEEALEITKNNLNANNAADKAEVVHVKDGRIMQFKNSIDVIICNPASLPTNNDLPVFCNGGFWGTGMIIQLLDLMKILLNAKNGAAYFIHTSLVPFSLIERYMSERRLKFERIAQKELLFRPFYNDIMAHLSVLKETYPEVSYINRGGNIFETISLLKVTKRDGL